MDRNTGIREVIERRGIENLIHFTQLDNLESILERGIVPTRTLEEQSVDFARNDEKRYDNRTDCVSLSVENPNLQYLNALRERDREAIWVILELDSACLYDQLNFFANHNAASTGIRYSTADRTTAEAFEAMFADTVKVIRSVRDYEISRYDGMPEAWPTSVQAEIQVLGVISKEYIKRVYVDVDAIGKPVLSRLGEMGITVCLAPEKFRVRRKIA